MPIKGRLLSSTTLLQLSDFQAENCASPLPVRISLTLCSVGKTKVMSLPDRKSLTICAIVSPQNRHWTNGQNWWNNFALFMLEQAGWRAIITENIYFIEDQKHNNFGPVDER